MAEGEGNERDVKNKMKYLIKLVSLLETGA